MAGPEELLAKQAKRSNLGVDGCGSVKNPSSGVADPVNHNAYYKRAGHSARERVILAPPLLFQPTIMPPTGSSYMPADQEGILLIVNYIV